MADSALIYRNAEEKARCIGIYEAALSQWPTSYSEVDLPTTFGLTHAIATGRPDAPPLILLHGQWATATMWSPLIAALSRHHRAIAVDQIDDVGKSEPTRIPSSRPHYAQWLEEVLNQLHVDSAHMVGLSYGGFLALNLALSAPTRVKKLVLLCPGIPSLGPPTASWAVHGIPVTIFPTRATAKWLVQGLSAGGFQPDNREMEQLMAGALAVRSRVPFRPAFAENELRKLASPVLLLIGEKETMYDPPSAMANAKSLIPQLHTHLIPGAGHMLTTDQPEAVAESIRAFLTV
jgi:pimeloyl-ACP methyl ester carboxylesterase